MFTSAKPRKYGCNHKDRDVDPQHFYYNKNKLKEGVAECIMAGNYPDDAANLTEQERLNMLLKLAALNTNVIRNGVHISLNFNPSEQHSKAFLAEISQAYMEKIGFGNQPYLCTKITIADIRISI